MFNAVLDSCILDFLLKNESSSVMSQFINRIASEQDIEDFLISDYAKFEVLRGARNIKGITSFLNTFSTIKVSPDVLSMAAFLYSAYQVKNICIPKDGDFILAATAFYTPNTFILTADGDDFPRSFFEEVEADYIHFKKAKTEKKIRIYLLKPLWEELSSALNKHRN